MRATSVRPATLCLFLCAALPGPAADGPLRPAPLAAQVEWENRPPEWRHPPTAVPYVPQEDLLCGPAALAMVYRAWGVRDVQPADWSRLVRPEEGGVRTGDLATAAAAGPSVERRSGWRTRSGSLDDMEALAAAARLGPVVVLVEDRPRLYHYLVILEVTATEVRFHDPASGPDRLLARDSFDRAWQKAGRWTLLVLPPPEARPGTPLRSGAGEPEPPPPVPRVLDASRLFRDGRWIEAARAAGPHAPRLRAAALYLGDRPDEALEAWAELDEARLDLLRIEGLHRTRHRVVHRHLGLRTREPLTPADLRRARRRLGALPSVAASRLEYRPVEGGRLAEVRAGVVERSRFPETPLSWAALAADALLNGRLGLGTGLTDAGEWLEVRGADAASRREIAVRMAAPGAAGLPGIVAVEGLRVEESHVGGAGSLERAALSLEDWATGSLRWTAAAALERRDGGAPRPAAEAEVALFSADDRERLRAAGRVGGGPSGAWGGWTLEGRVERRGATSWSAIAWWEGTAGPAHRLAWPGAGTGRVRDRLLRAHPLEEDGAVAGAAFAPRLAGATVEVARWLPLAGPVRLGAAAFLDAARTGGGGASEAFLDAGLGLRAALPGLPGALRLDAARGLTDGAAAVSLGWSGRRPGAR